MANQRTKKGQRTQKRNQPSRGGRPYMTTTRTTDEVRTGMGGARTEIRPIANGLCIKNSGILAVYPTSSNARATGFGLNPIDPNPFPWVSNIAQCYSQYRWKKLRLLWQSTTGTGVAGDVSLGICYDIEEVRAYQALINSGSTACMQAVASSRDVMAGPVWGSRCQTVNGRMTADIMVDVDVKRAHSRFNWFIMNRYRAGSTESAEDNMAVGIYPIAHLGGNGSFVGNAGVLWVDYEIEVVGPVSPSLQPPTPLFRQKTSEPWPPVWPTPTPVPPPREGGSTWCGHFAPLRPSTVGGRPGGPRGPNLILHLV